MDNVFIQWSDAILDILNNAVIFEERKMIIVSSTKHYYVTLGHFSVIKQHSIFSYTTNWLFLNKEIENDYTALPPSKQRGDHLES